jgi:hypothetical protein
VLQSESQLEAYTQEISDGEDGFPDDDLEFSAGFDCEARSMMALHVMLEAAFDNTDVGSISDHHGTLHAHEAPLLLALHIEDREAILPILERLAVNPEALASFYKEFLPKPGTGLPQRCSRRADLCNLVLSVWTRIVVGCWFSFRNSPRIVCRSGQACLT